MAVVGCLSTWELLRHVCTMRLVAKNNQKDSTAAHGPLRQVDFETKAKPNATNIFCRQCMAAIEVHTFTGLCAFHAHFSMCVLWCFVLSLHSNQPSESLVSVSHISLMSRCRNHALASGDMTSKIPSLHISMGGGGISL